MYRNGCQLGVLSFLASAHPAGTCGNNGLPLTPYSVRIAGRTEAVLGIQHAHLCKYVSVKRSRHERIFLTMEYYSDNAFDRFLKNTEQRDLPKLFDTIVKMLFQLLKALQHLDRDGIVVRTLSAENVCLDSNGDVKIANFGFNYIVENGSSVDFPVGEPRYQSPERIAAGPLAPANPKEDVWAVGLFALECICGAPLGPVASEVDRRVMAKYFQHILNYADERRREGLQESYTYGDQAAQDLAHLRRLLEFTQQRVDLSVVPQQLVSLVAMCLHPIAVDRPTAAEILQHPVFQQLADQVEEQSLQSLRCFSLPSLREIPEHADKLVAGSNDMPSAANLSPAEALVLQSVECLRNPLLSMSVDQVFHVWTLAGGDVEAELVRRGLVVSEPPICTVPTLVRKGVDARPPRTSGSGLLPVAALEFDGLVKRLASARLDLFPELLPLGEEGLPAARPLEGATLPLLIRERDLDYQVQRTAVMQRLLRGMPYTREFVRREAKVDVPPLCRGAVWRVLLDVSSNAEEIYKAIDKDIDTSTDHQLDLDIPRCHQYDVIMSSPMGHARLREVLKAWVVSHKGLTYWQGLDSLCAPFLRLNFNELHFVYACFDAFINRYLTNFFLKDNAEVIGEYLVVFSHTLAFHDPILFNHVTSIGFIPELYAISWFLTCFAHVFPLDKIFHLWDKLLLGDSRMPLCIGVAILIMLRGEILESDFNSCILRFSDVPDVDVEVCAQKAVELCRDSPPSVLARQKSTPPGELVSCPSIDKRKQFKSPTLSMADFQEMFSAGADNLLVIDTRPPQEFANSRLEHSSFNINADEAFLDDGSLKPDVLEETRRAFEKVRLRHPTIVVAWHRTSIVERLSAQLVAAGFPRLAILDGGLIALRDCGMVRPRKRLGSDDR